MTQPGVRPAPDQVREWRDTGHTYKLIAAAIAEWADGKERGTVLPDDQSFGIEASGSTHKRAKKFLVTQGVLEINDGPFYVALHARTLPRSGTAPSVTVRSRPGADCARTSTGRQ
jgi:hypothetical protein